MFEEHCARANEACKAVPVRETEAGRRVFVPKPSSVGSFTNALVDTLLGVLIGKATEVHVAPPKFGGRIFTFPSTQRAQEVKAMFPVTVSHLGKTFVFEVADDAPEDLNDYKCKIMRLPVRTTTEEVTTWAKAVALDPRHVKKVHLYTTRSGRATEAALIIFEVAPPQRLCKFNLHNFGAVTF